MTSPSKLRWRLAGDDGGQEALFEEVERHIGRGEFRGMEFLHVHARSIINEVPAASRVPFRYTINAYRGCSHACTYCLEGSTAILMADGTTKPLADLRVGDEIVGTAGSGAGRRFVTTPVLDHWATVKHAYRVSLTDGTELVCSADHRFLTTGGWKYTVGTGHGRYRRPHLSTNTRLLGTGSRFSVEAKRGGHLQHVRVLGGPGEHLQALDTVDPAVTGNRVIDGDALEGRYPLTVEAVERTGVKIPMYDITTGTGDYVSNGVISHNCFARPTHDYLGLNIGDDFENKIVVKVNAVERLRAELAPGRWAGDHIAMGTNTDPYQRCEGKYRLTRGIVETLTHAGNPFSILTKSTLILRDLDVLADAARDLEVGTSFSIGTLDEEVWRMTEPGTPHPAKRVEAVAKLNEAGVPCGVLVAPVLPGLSDRPDQLEAVVKACAEAGARSISPILLHLRPGVRDHYMGWLAGARPDLVGRYDEMYPRAYAPRKRQDELAGQVADFVARYRGRSPTPRRFRAAAAAPPVRRRPAKKEVEQLGLELGP